MKGGENTERRENSGGKDERVLGHETTVAATIADTIDAGLVAVNEILLTKREGIQKEERNIKKERERGTREQRGGDQQEPKHPRHYQWWRRCSTNRTDLKVTF